VKILFDGCDFSSSSGPNAFGLKLAREFTRMGHVIADADSVDRQLSFITMRNALAPTVLRLDGIYFNLAQDYQQQNAPIRSSYERAERIVVQSYFDLELVGRYFGHRDNVAVIHNGTDLDEVRNAPIMQSSAIDGCDRVWCCASSWRPHKRLQADLRYFMEHAGSKDCMIVCGDNPNHVVSDPRVFYAGQLDRQDLLSVFRRADVFVHLPWLGHCDNVLIDARAAGCEIVCTDSGGTSEIAGLDATLIEDAHWDWRPCMLYDPPPLDFSRKRFATIDSESDIDIRSVARRYINELNLATCSETGVAHTRVSAETLSGDG